MIVSVVFVIFAVFAVGGSITAVIESTPLNTLDDIWLVYVCG
jgi:hypothetical protein